MMLGSYIANYRRKLGLTQEQLAQKLDVTNQAVSKWEADQCCPDVALLPRLSDIFGVSIDELFGRERQHAKQPTKQLPWEDDDALHIVLFNGHTLIGAVSKENQDCTFHYEGPAKDIYCAVNLTCGDVDGSVRADGDVESGDISGSVQSGGYVECGDVGGDVNSANYVECGDVDGNVSAVGYVECGNVGGHIVSGNCGGCFSFGGK